MTGRTVVILNKNIDDWLGSPTPTPVSSPDGMRVQEGLSTTGNFMQLVGLVILLIFILVAAYLTTKFVGGIKQKQLRSSNFQVIDSYRVSPNKMLQLIKIGNKFVVIAIGKDTINLITEVDEAEVMIRDTSGGEMLNFKQILDKLKNKNE